MDPTISDASDNSDNENNHHDNNELPHDVLWNQRRSTDDQNDSSEDSEKDNEFMEAEDDNDECDEDLLFDEENNGSRNENDEEQKEDSEESLNCQLERDLLAICNGLQLLHDHQSNDYHRSRNVMLTQETMMNLQDLVKLIKQSVEVDADGQRSLTSELLLLNPKYRLLETSLMPLWEACVDANEDPEYLERLLFIFSRVLIPPDRSWKYSSVPHRVRWYLISIQTAKRVFLSPLFWRGIDLLFQRLQAEQTEEGKTYETKKKYELLVKEREELEGDDPQISKRGERIERYHELHKLIQTIESQWGRRKQDIETMISWLRLLILSLLRLCDVPTFFSGLCPDFPLSESSDSDYQLNIVASIAKYGLWELFETEWRELMSLDAFSRNKRRVINGASVDTTILWRVLDFYTLLAAILPPDDVASIMLHEKPKIPVRSHETQLTMNRVAHGRAALQRHSRFNPRMIRKRVTEAQGSYASVRKKDRLPRSAGRRFLRSARALLDNSGPHIQFEFQDIRMKPLGQITGLDDIARTSQLKALIPQKDFESLIIHIQSFLRFAFPRCIPAWIVDVQVEDAILGVRRNIAIKHDSANSNTIDTPLLVSYLLNYLHSKFDPFKIVNLMSWMLRWKRKEIITRRERLEELLKDNENSEELIRRFNLTTITDVLALRCCLDPVGVSFVNKLFHEQVKKQQFKKGADRLGRICLRGVAEQIQFGLCLMSHSHLTPESLIDVGKTVLIDVLNSSLTINIVWALRNIKVSWDHDCILYLFEVTFFLLRAFSKLGGAVTITLPSRRFGQSTSEAGSAVDEDQAETAADGRPAITRTRKVELKDFLSDLFDGRIICNLIKSLRTYKTNPHGVNICVVRLLTKLTRERDRRARTRHQHLVCIFFQLSYFDLFVTILNDQPYHARADANEVVEFVQWIVDEFWKVFERNRFVVIELFMAKNLSSSLRDFGYSDPEALMSIYTNYKEGLDKEYITMVQQATDDVAVEDWRNKIRAERKARGDSWLAEESMALVKHWDGKRKLPHFLRQIKKAMKSKRQLKSIRAQLIHLRVLEPDYHEESTFESDNEDDIPTTKQHMLPLLRAVLEFKELSLVANGKALFRHPAAKSNSDGSIISSNDLILQNILNILTEIYLLKGTGDFQPPCDITVDVPDQTSTDIIRNPCYKQLMNALGAVTKSNSPNEIQPNSVPSEDEHFVVKSGITAMNLHTRIRKLDEYIPLSIEEIKARLPSELPRNDINKIEFLRQLNRIRVIGYLAALKTAERQLTWGNDSIRSIHAVYRKLKRAEKLMWNNEQQVSPESNTTEDGEEFDVFKMLQELIENDNHCHVNPDHYFEHCCNLLKLPDGVTSQSIGSALAAALDHVARQRKKHLMETGAIDITKWKIFGQLQFPPQEPGSTFELIVQFVLYSKHPILWKLLISLGFERCLVTQINPTVGIEDNEKHNETEFCWAIPSTMTLQRLELHLQHLRAYTMANLNHMVDLLEQSGTNGSNELHHPRPTQPHKNQYDTRHQEINREEENERLEVPYLEINQFLAADSRKLAKVVRELRMQAQDIPEMTTRIIDSFKHLMEIIEQWATRRQQYFSEDNHKGFQQDLILGMQQGTKRFDTTEVTEREDNGDTLSLSNLGPFKDMREIQRCLYMLYGRPDDVLTPRLWFWSHGCEPHVIHNCIDKAKLFLEADMKLVKQYSKGKTTLDQLKVSANRSEDSMKGDRLSVLSRPLVIEKNEFQQRHEDSVLSPVLYEIGEFEEKNCPSKAYDAIPTQNMEAIEDDENCFHCDVNNDYECQERATNTSKVYSVSVNTENIPKTRFSNQSIQYPNNEEEEEKNEHGYMNTLLTPQANETDALRELNHGVSSISSCQNNYSITVTSCQPFRISKRPYLETQQTNEVLLSPSNFMESSRMSPSNESVEDQVAKRRSISLLDDESFLRSLISHANAEFQKAKAEDRQTGLTAKQIEEGLIALQTSTKTSSIDFGRTL